jgi:hypothetical protein
MNVTNKSLTPYMRVILTEEEKADFAWRQKHTKHERLVKTAIHRARI